MLTFMAQLTIYLDKDTQAKARRAAQKAGYSLSRWAREQLNAAADKGQAWPDSYFDLFGSIQDPTFDAPEKTSFERDRTRETL